MRKLLIAIFISFYSYAVDLFNPLQQIASVRKIQHNSYCMCWDDVLPAEFDEAQIAGMIGKNSAMGDPKYNEVHFAFSDATRTCMTKVEEIFNANNEAAITTKMNAALNGESLSEDPQKVLCTQSAINAKRREYKRRLKEGSDFFRNIVKKKICNNKDAPIENIRPGENRCANKLKGLVDDFEEIDVDYCQFQDGIDYSRGTDGKCIERESYRYIVTLGEDDFIVAHCRQRVDAAYTEQGLERSGAQYEKMIKDCNFGIKKIIGAGLYKDDFVRCENTRDFNQETWAPGVCSNIIISPQIDFISEDEQAALLQCLQDNVPRRPNNVPTEADQEAIRNCVHSLFDSNEELCFGDLIEGVGDIRELLPAESATELTGNQCIVESQLLEELKNRYCPERLLETRHDADLCMKMILEQGLRIFDVKIDELKKCEEVAQSAPEATREAVKKKCIRAVLYSKMLENQMLEVSDCWDKNKYKTVRERLECSENAKRFYRELEACEIMTEPARVQACLSELEPKDFLRQYLEKKAIKFGINVQDCDPEGVQSVYVQCMLGKLFPGAEQYNMLRGDIINNCNKQGTGLLQACTDAVARIDRERLKIPENQRLSATQFQALEEQVRNDVAGVTAQPSPISVGTNYCEQLGYPPLFGLEGDNERKREFTRSLEAERERNCLAEINQLRQGRTEAEANSLIEQRRNENLAKSGKGELLSTTFSNVNGSNGTNGSTGASGTNTAGTVAVVAGTGARITRPNSPQEANDQLTNFQQVSQERFDDGPGIFKSFRNMKFRKHPDHLCKNIGKGAMLRVAGTVGGVITAAVVHMSVMKKHKKDGGQIKAFDHLKQAWKGALAGIGVKLAFNTMARMIYRDNEAKAASVIATEGRVPRCRYEDIPSGDTAFLTPTRIEDTYIIRDFIVKNKIYNIFEPDRFKASLELDEMSLLLAEIDSSEDMKVLDEFENANELKIEIRKNIAKVMNALFIINSAHASEEQKEIAAGDIKEFSQYSNMFYQTSENSNEYEDEAGAVEVLPHSSNGSQDTNNVISTITSSQMPQIMNQLKAISTIDNSDNEEKEEKEEEEGDK